MMMVGEEHVVIVPPLNLSLLLLPRLECDPCSHPSLGLNDTVVVASA